MRIVIIVLTMIFMSGFAFAEVLQGGVIHENGKTITPFYYQGQSNGYGVQYDDDPYHAYYYDVDGKMNQYDVLDKPRNVFPHSTTSYDAQGNVISTSKSISKTEQYVYYPDGRLRAHWVGNNCYDADGKLLSSKRTLK